jgi:hypothetical protein
MKPQPIREGRTKGNIKKHTSEGRQAPPPPKPPRKVDNIKITIN